MMEIGHGVAIEWDEDRGGIWWRHPGCRPWFTLRFQPDPKSTGHTLELRDPLTIGGSLLCPKGCGTHGYIRNGRWEPC
jgi:hypothetical protein